ncbi:unnamed protein product [Spirodela intermedia]|uniref:Uncharacterized protein n=1 Tax=Spirodela intermedia TaxID=51605 RepID=A0ABN7E933_SPIIN|nr:unnamed protein product [Spirodela intermedia]
MKWALESSSMTVTRRTSWPPATWKGSGTHVSLSQEEALHRIWYALRRWRLVSRQIVLFPTTACSSINRR